MNRIKKMNSIFILYRFQYKTAELSFLNWIYIQCNSKDIEIINKLWFYYPHLLNHSMLYDLYSRNGKYEKFLYF